MPTSADRRRSVTEPAAPADVDLTALVPASERQDYLVAELRAGTPAVFVDREPRGVDADSVVVDNRAGARLATEHLLARGHRLHVGRVRHHRDDYIGVTDGIRDVLRALATGVDQLLAGLLPAPEGPAAPGA